jgi:hypothetical protein
VGSFLEGKRIIERKTLKGKGKNAERKMLEGLVESLHQELSHRLQKAKLRKNFIHSP